MQKEMLKMIAHTILLKVALSHQNSHFYTVMVDVRTDISNSEQVILCFRWVDKKFDVREEFLGLYKVDKIDSDTIFSVIKDILLRWAVI